MTRQVHLSDLPAVPLRRRRPAGPEGRSIIPEPTAAAPVPEVPSFLDTARLDAARERLRGAIPPLSDD